MGGRKNTGLLEDLFAIVAMLPWWISCALAVVAYLVLHGLASAEVVISIAPGQMGQMVVRQMAKSMALYGQYVVPLLFLAGALASFLGRRKREGLVREAAESRNGDAIRNMSWKDFELLVGEVFRMQGFSVVETGGGGADGGIDLQLKKDGELFLVQCKQWRAWKVSVNVVRELFGVMAAHGAAGGFVVTSGVFTKEARVFAVGRNIELVDGSALEEMIEKARARKLKLEVHGGAALETEPGCPRCGGAMFKRTAKQGAYAGAEFWGCADFPKCRGTRPAA